MVSNASLLILIHRAFCNMNMVLLDIQLHVIQTGARKLPDKEGNKLSFTKYITHQAQAKGNSSGYPHFTDELTEAQKMN